MWLNYSLEWTVRGTRYHIHVANPEHRCAGVAAATLDGARVDPQRIPIVEDGNSHDVEIILGRNGTSTSSDQRVDSSYVT
jgi:cellobiose phosphorylase